MSAATGLGASLLAVLVHPRWWVLSLAGFLVRGGVVVLLLPLVPLPSTAALANALGPTLVGFVFGGPSVPFLVLVGSIALISVAWFVLASYVGSALDLALVRDVAADDDLESRIPPEAGSPWRAVAVRWLAHLPTVVAVVLGLAAIVDAAYSELIRPGDAAVPVALRVILRVPVHVGAIIATWFIGEAVGGIAVRRLAWGSGIRRSIVQGVTGLVRPPGLLVLLITSTAVLGAVIVGDLAAGSAFGEVRIAFLDGGSVLERGLSIGLLSLSWAATGVLVAIATAWRSTAWTFEVGRLQPPGQTR